MPVVYICDRSYICPGTERPSRKEWFGQKRSTNILHITYIVKYIYLKILCKKTRSTNGARGMTIFTLMCQGTKSQVEYESHTKLKLESEQ